MELHKEAAALQVSGCRECLWPFAGAGEAEDGFAACSRSVIPEDLCFKVKDLWERPADFTASEKTRQRLCSCYPRLQLEEPKFQLYQRRSALWVSDWEVETHNCKSWKLVTSGTRRKAPAPPEDLQLWNTFSMLRKDEGLRALSNEA